MSPVVVVRVAVGTAASGSVGLPATAGLSGPENPVAVQQKGAVQPMDSDYLDFQCFSPKHFDLGFFSGHFDDFDSEGDHQLAGH